MQSTRIIRLGALDEAARRQGSGELFISSTSSASDSLMCRCRGNYATRTGFHHISAWLLQLRLGQRPAVHTRASTTSSKRCSMADSPTGKGKTCFSSIYIGYLYVGAFSSNSVRWCTRYTWQDAQWTTLSWQPPTVHCDPTCSHQQLIFTSPSSVTKSSCMLDLHSCSMELITSQHSYRI